MRNLLEHPDLRVYRTVLPAAIWKSAFAAIEAACSVDSRLLRAGDTGQVFRDEFNEVHEALDSPCVQMMPLSCEDGEDSEDAVSLVSEEPL